MNILFVLLVFFICVHQIASGEPQNGDGIRLVTEVRDWKIRLSENEEIWYETARPERANRFNLVYNFPYSLDEICTVERDSFTGRFTFSVQNVFTLEKTTRRQLSFGMGHEHTHLFTPMTCFKYDGYTLIVSKHRQLNFTAVQRGSDVKVLKNWKYDNLRFDNARGELYGSVGPVLFTVSLPSLLSVWTRNLSSNPAPMLPETWLPIMMNKVCDWRGPAPLFWSIFDGKLLYMYNDRSFYSSEICTQNYSTIHLLDEPSGHIPFFLFPEKVQTGVAYLHEMPYESNVGFPLFLVSPFVLVFLLALIIFRKTLAKFCPNLKHKEPPIDIELHAAAPFIEKTANNHPYKSPVVMQN